MPLESEAENNPLDQILEGDRSLINGGLIECASLSRSRLFRVSISYDSNVFSSQRTHSLHDIVKPSQTLCLKCKVKKNPSVGSTQ